MERLDMSRPWFYLPPEEREVQRRLARHLNARMCELAGDGLEVVRFREEEGLVVIAAPQVENLAGQLRWNLGVRGRADGETVQLWTHPELRFEDMDAIWGALNDLLCE